LSCLYLRKLEELEKRGEQYQYKQLQHTKLQATATP
jgi:hypothetical protein